MAENFAGLDITALAARLKAKDLSAEDKASLDDAIWNKVSRIGRRAEKLDPQNKEELTAFKSLLKSLPRAYRIELGEKLDIIKSAETRLFRAERGIDDRTAEDKLKEGLEQGMNSVKNGVTKSAAKLQRNYNVGKRFARMAVNKKKTQTKNWIKNKKQSYDKWVDDVDAKIDAWVNKAAKSLENIENGIREIPGQLKEMSNAAFNQVKQSYKLARDKARARQEALKRRRRQQWNKFKAGVKTTAKGTALVLGGMLSVTAKGAVWGAKQLRRGWQQGKRIIAGIKLPEVKGRANENSTLLDMANGNLAALKPEQVKNLYNELKKYRDTARGNKYGDAYYRVSAYSTELLDEIKSKGKEGVTDENADKVAAWLEVNKNIQEEVNKNRSVEYNKRNEDIADLLDEHKPQINPKKKGIEMTAEEYAPYKAFAVQLGMTANAAFVRDCQNGKYKDAFEAFHDNYKAKGGEQDARQELKETREKETEKTRAEVERQAAETTPKEPVVEKAVETENKEPEKTPPVKEAEKQAEPQTEKREEPKHETRPLQRPRALEPQPEPETPAPVAETEKEKKRSMTKSNLRKIQELRGVKTARRAKQVTMDNRGKFKAKENAGEEAEQIDMVAYQMEQKRQRA